MDDPKKHMDDAVVHRLLQMYSAMTFERRRADRQSKKQADAPDEYQYDDDIDSRTAGAGEYRDDVKLRVRAIVEKDGLVCPSCGGGRLKLLSHETVDEKTILLEFLCEECETLITHPCSKDRLKEIMA